MHVCMRTRMRCHNSKFRTMSIEPPSKKLRILPPILRRITTLPKTLQQQVYAFTWEHVQDFHMKIYAQSKKIPRFVFTSDWSGGCTVDWSRCEKCDDINGVWLFWSKFPGDDGYASDGSNYIANKFMARVKPASRDMNVCGLCRDPDLEYLAE